MIDFFELKTFLCVAISYKYQIFTVQTIQTFTESHIKPGTI